MTTAILETQGLSRTFNGFHAVSNVSLSVREGSIHALIGPNGAGKTTCFNLLTRFIDASAGCIRFKGQDITRTPADAVARLGLVRSFQISAVFGQLSVFENVRLAVQRRGGHSMAWWRSDRSLAQYDDASAGAAMAMRLWQGRAVEMLPMLHAMDEAPGLPVGAAVAMYLGRAGRVDEARDYLETHPIDFEPDDWFSFFIWGCAADAAFMTGRKDIAASAYERLAPFAGRPLCAGSAMAMGPVDAFLALAAYTTGETDLATGHADAALELCQTWDIPLAAAWLQDQRDAHGF